MNCAKAAFAGWSDRLTVALGVPFLVLVARSWLATLPSPTVGYIAAAAGVATGFLAMRLAKDRIEYHQTLGIMPEAALRPRVCSAVTSIIVGALLAVAGAIVAAAHPESVGPFLVGGLVGIAVQIALLPLRVCFPAAPIGNAVRSIGAFFATRRAGALLGIATGAPAVLADGLLEEDATSAIAVLMAGVAMLCLASLDHERVRFLGQWGFGPWLSIWLCIQPVAVFGALAIPLLALGSAPLGAAIVAGLWTAVLLFQALRTLCYLLYPKRMADFVAGLAFGAVALAVFALPVAAPIIVLVLLWQMATRASSKTWLLP